MTSQVLWATDTRLSADLGSAARARAFVAARLNERELTQLVDDVQLVVSELVTNAVVHARAPIVVALAQLPLCIRLTVFDGSNQLPEVRPGHGTNGDAEGGRGLWVTEACSASWGTNRSVGGGKSVWAVFSIPLEC